MCYFNPISLVSEINTANWAVGNNGQFEVVVDALDNAETYYLYEKRSNSSEYVLVAQSNTNVIKYNAFNSKYGYAVKTKSIFGYESDLFVLEEYNVLGDTSISATDSTSIYSSSYGVENLIDGVFGENTGRYSSKVNTGATLDVTLNLGGTYTLSELRLYDFTNNKYQDASYAGANLTIQVYTNGSWKTVVTCASNAEILAHRSSNADDTGYKYLSFNLGGVSAEKIRIYINGSLSGKSISYYEVKSFGYRKIT